MAREPLPPGPSTYPGSAQPVGPGAPPPERRRGSWWIGILGAIAGIAAVLLVFWLIDVMAGDDEDTDGAGQVITPPVTASPLVLSVGTVMSNPDQYMGQEITVGGTVRGAVSPGLAHFGGAAYDTENLLLLTSDPAPGSFPAAADARATGMLTRLNIAEAEQTLGVDLDEDLLQDSEGEIALLAESMHYFVSGEFGATSMIDLQGQEVTFVGSVDEIVSERAFLSEDILIIAEEGVEFAASEEAIIRAHGIAGVISEDMGPDVGSALSEEQIDEYLGHAMLIADSVEFIE